VLLRAGPVSSLATGPGWRTGFAGTNGPAVYVTGPMRFFNVSRLRGLEAKLTNTEYGRAGMGEQKSAAKQRRAARRKERAERELVVFFAIGSGEVYISCGQQDFLSSSVRFEVGCFLRKKKVEIFTFFSFGNVFGD